MTLAPNDARWVQVGFWAGRRNQDLEALLQGEAKRIDDEIASVREQLGEAEVFAATHGKELANWVATVETSQSRWTELLSRAEASGTSFSGLSESRIPQALVTAALVSGVAALYGLADWIGQPFADFRPWLLALGPVCLAVGAGFALARVTPAAILRELARSSAIAWALVGAGAGIGLLSAVGSSEVDFVGFCAASLFAGVSIAARLMASRLDAPVLNDLSRQAESARAAATRAERERGELLQRLLAVPIELRQRIVELERQKRELCHLIARGHHLGRLL